MMHHGPSATELPVANLEPRMTVAMRSAILRVWPCVLA
jgi:hypothetical protein